MAYGDDLKRYDHQAVDGNVKPMGWERITALSAAVGLTVPVGARIALLIAETQAVRFRDDGTNPTATIGMPIFVNTPFWYNGDLSAFKVIEQAVSASLDILYYA